MSDLKLICEILKKSSFQLNTIDPKANFNELNPLSTMLSKAKIVGIGEATHGSMEFTVVRHRVLQYLIDEMGFSGLILETPQEQAKQIDKYIKGTKGNISTLLNDLGYWVHNTEEMLNVIEWMKKHNEQHPTRQISFWGCDIPADDERRFGYMGLRDEAMADICIDILQQNGKDTRAVLWSHNMHIYYSGDLDTQGKFLKEKLGDEYFSIVSLFNNGEFNAFLWNSKTERTSGFKLFHLNDAPEGFFEYILAKVETDLAIIDTQKVRKQLKLHDNKAPVLKVREIGSVFAPNDPENFKYSQDLFNNCDGIIWINTVSSARSLQNFNV